MSRQFEAPPGKMSAFNAPAFPFRSIRARLAASYILLSVLTVGAVGLLALALIQRSAAQQERLELANTAQAIAQQAEPLLSFGEASSQLEQLAQTAAFYGNLRVRILDADQNVLVDSGRPGENTTLAWLALPEYAAEPVEDTFSEAVLGWLMMPEHHMGPGEMRARMQTLLEQVSQGQGVTILRRSSGPWGTRFELVSPGSQADLLAALALAENEALESPEAGDAAAQGDGQDAGTTGDSGEGAEADVPRSAASLQQPVGDPAAPLGYIVLSEAARPAAPSLDTARRSFLAAGAAAALLAGGLGLVMGRRLTRPLTTLGASAARISAGDLSERAPISGQDEIARLAGQFNAMAGQLEASFTQLADERDALRRFIADASHELRTPITALKNFNALLQGPAAGDPAAQAEFLSESAAQIDRLEWITRNLLDLSRLDAGLVQLELAPLAAGELLNAVAAARRRQAAGQSVALYVEPPAGNLLVRADRARLELALLNLLDNAIKFSPPGESVQLGAAAADGGVQFWVRDHGPGIPPESQPHIFERFYRAPGVTAPGSGLGLAIVQSIMHAHGGRVSVESAPGQGACFNLYIPY